MNKMDLLEILTDAATLLTEVTSDWRYRDQPLTTWSSVYHAASILMLVADQFRSQVKNDHENELMADVYDKANNITIPMIEMQNEPIDDSPESNKVTNDISFIHYTVYDLWHVEHNRIHPQ